MRFRAISSLAFSLIFFGALSTAIMTTGCSGGGSNPLAPVPTPTPSATPPPAAPTTVKATLVWGPRSRQASLGSSVGIAGLSSSQSAIVTLTSAQPNGSDLVFGANRSVPAAGGSQLVTSTQTGVPGSHLLSVKFYNRALLGDGTLDPSAQLVGIAMASVQVQTDGTISGTVTTTGQIRSLQVVPGQVINVGQTVDVSYTAFGDPVNGQPVVIAVPNGAALVTVQNSDATRQNPLTVANGSVTGVYPGKAVATISLDGINNDGNDPASVVTVVSNASVTETVSAPIVTVGGQVTFSAQVTPNTVNQGIIYSLAPGMPAGVTLDPNTGVFAAGNQSGQTYTVIATSVYDPTKTAQASVLVKSGVTIISNLTVGSNSNVTSLNLGANKSQSLPVSVLGTTNMAVNYVVREAATGGTVTTSGLYTAPNTQGQFHVDVASQADTAQVATFTITVGPSVTLGPHSTTISVGQTITFFANVVGGGNNQVVYTTDGGTIDAAGRYTAPGISGIYHVTATSVADPTQSDTATVTVQAGSGVINVQ